MLNELKQYGIHTLKELQEIIPTDYTDVVKEETVNVYGTVRDWMIIHDLERFLEKVEVNWVFLDTELNAYSRYLTAEQVERLAQKVGVEGDPDRQLL